MLINGMPRYEILSEEADGRARPRLAADRLASSASSSCSDEALELFRRPRARRSRASS